MFLRWAILITSKTIVITGSSDGIGAEAARVFSRKGHRVIVVGRSADKTRKIASELSSSYFCADYISLDSVRDLVGFLRSEVKHIDILINNAGAVSSN